MKWPLLALLVACARAPTPTSPPPAPEMPRTPPATARWPGPKVVARARVVAMGDVLPHTNVKHAAAAAAKAGGAHEGWSALFGGIQARVAAADVAFANLETPVAPDAHVGTGSMVFNAPPALPEALVAIGFDVLSFANNHVYDQGRAGLVETLDRVAAAGLVQIGAGPTCAEARRHRMVEAGGLRLAWIGATRLFNNRLNRTDAEPCAWELDVEGALEEVRAARAAGADAVILSVHWGREYHTEPDAAEVDVAHALLDGGVDVILGHHPHVVQPLELHDTPDGRTGLVAYSLGNLISNQAYDYRFGLHPHARGQTRDGLMLAFEVQKKDYGPGTEPRVVVEVAGVSAIPLWTDSDANGRIVAPAPTIRVVPVGDTLETLYTALDTETDPGLRLALQKRIELLRVRWWSVEQIVGRTWMPAEPR